MSPEQPQTPATSPRLVCGRTMTSTGCNAANYREQTIYFCTEFCLEAFHADPDRFYQAHSRSAQAVVARENN